MKRCSARAGFVLPMSLMILVVVAIVVASVGRYVSFAARQTRVFLAKDRCRFAAFSAIEQAKSDIQQGFEDYIANNFASIQIAPGKAKAYNWFNKEHVSGDRRTIGSPNPVTLFSGQAYPIVENGCNIWIGIGEGVDHVNNASVATVPIVATATYVYPDGLAVSATIQEWILFGTDQSKVFDNAYFVNNYGWMNGNFTINGEFRANGNVSLKGGCVVNGFVYAAPNSEIANCLGKVTINNASIKNHSAYQSAGSRARYDIANLNEIGSYNPATASGTISRPTYDTDGKVTAGSKAAYDASGELINDSDSEAYLAIVKDTYTVNDDTVQIPSSHKYYNSSTKEFTNINADSAAVTPVEMPFVADLAPYEDFAREEGGTLQYPSVTYTDSTGASHTVQGGTVNACNTLSMAGPSGDASLADAGSLLLVGTKSNPIQLNGPVVVEGDVIIKGYVTGQGTIYAGRNVHIIGDIKYVNAPTWTKSNVGTAAENEQEQNESKDMLALIAKGNVVVGDSTSSSIAANVNSGDTIAYSCDENDSAIGYPSKAYSSTQKVTTTSYGGRTTTTTKTSNTFSGNYTQTEQINGLSSSLVATAPGGYQSSSGQFGKVRTETQYVTEQKQVQKYVRTGWNSGYYTWVTENVTTEKKTLATSYDRKYYETICDDAIIKNLRGTVSQVDAVIYNNHGVYGSLGASFQINGALVCRDEGLTANGGTFNWDMRLRRKKNSKVIEKMGLPPGPSEPYVVEWLEVPDSQNPVFHVDEEDER